ncbi:Pectate lyase superfamily protein [Actinacidiphila yanglinensis]|uniref:Pectate lyase superfamily protein n=1 Tax=Actinacidiphila yanglinensis TaxID=310779 RepID=A0A1H5T3W1_9ACTN|nr:discoidin domain-containing protein [Actinacidiphila yanglinensis]SEF57459.1 Pectate lyase superfamily protein [Actinacidiphila yanglinensis]
MDTRRRSSLVLASATAAAVAAGGLIALTLTAQSADAANSAAVDGARAPAVSPFDVSGGASVPFTEYEAEAANTTGQKIGPDYTQGTVASEASGRQAVTLDQGQYVEFTLTQAANAVDVAYNLPQGASGTMSVYVNGTKLDQKLAVTSQYSYVSTGNIVGSRTHHLFDDSRIRLGQNLAAGAKVKLQLDSGDTGTATVDVTDFEQVAAAAAQPANSVSVVDDGADPSGAGDSTQAFRQAISDAKAQGKEVWIPSGDFKITSQLPVDDVTLRGAGNWWSVVHSSHFIDQTSATGNTKLYDFAVFGDVSVRNDNSPDNFVTGSLGPNSVVSGMWIQREKCGLWLTGDNTDLTVENNRIIGTTADGLNLDGSAQGVTVRNNFLRNQGDDSLAMWSLGSPDTGNTFTGNTIVQPNLANGIAIYGGSNNTASNNVIADTNALGSGLAVSNQAFLQPFNPLSGKVTVSGNTLIRTGAMNPNWSHPMGALRVDSYDSAITTVDVRISDTTFVDSPYSDFEFVSGGGHGYDVSGVTVSGATATGTGTVVVQAETPGSATFSDVTATGTGATGVYDCSYPAGTAPFTINQGSGNSGWTGTWPDCSTWPQPGGGDGSGGTTTGGSTGGTTPPADGNLAKGRPATDTGHADVYTASNAVDGDANSYWESTDNAFPQSLTVDLGSAQGVGRLVLKLPPASAWATRTETLSVLGSTDGSTFTTLKASAGYTFDPASGNTATVSLSSASTRYLRLTFTANTGWPAGQLSELEAYAS